MLVNNIHVAVRIRGPYCQDESAHYSIDDAEENNLVEGSRLLINKDNDSVPFDYVFGPKSTQFQLFFRCGVPLIDSVFEGFNACLFAYGQTGSGKTYSMLGSDGGRGSARKLDGLIPQIASEIFRRIKRQTADAEALLGMKNMSSFELTTSYIEVYKGQVFDLLSETGERKGLSLREEPTQTEGQLPHVYALGAKEERVDTTAYLLSLIERGSQRRRTEKTGMNEHSSRSHALLTLRLEHRWRPVGGREQSGGTSSSSYLSRVSRLLLVDLAGSESMEEAHQGMADKAGCSINLGLMCLGMVCTALAKKSKKVPNDSKPAKDKLVHVPYRDSVLTRLMQSSLGGHSRTWMLACVSPYQKRPDEGLRSLALARRVRTVQAKPAAQNRAIELKINDPMHGDVDDFDVALDRRAIWIETTKWGDIFARAAGNSSDPLLLYVHGSGPRNSSLEWNWLVFDIALRAQMMAKNLKTSKFYHVALDCPGYGRSEGDRQTIRSYPHAFLCDVIKSLGLCAYGWW